MSKTSKTSTKRSQDLRPLLTIEAQESRCTALAYKLVEQRLLDGSASSQETTHFLKIGSTKAQMELEKMRFENELTIAKTKALANADEMKVLYEEALKAMRAYNGQGEPEEYEYYEEDY
jgi:hypothetical protein